MTSAAVVTSLKAIFSRHGIPVTFVSDNGPQFNSEEMRTFAKEYGFQYTMSSPYYPSQMDKLRGLLEQLSTC